MCFGLLYLGPTVAFSAYSASCTIFLNVSYALPVIVLLIRGRSTLREHQTNGKLFNLGKWGLPINLVATVFVLVTSIVSIEGVDVVDDALLTIVPVLLLPQFNSSRGQLDELRLCGHWYLPSLLYSLLDLLWKAVCGTGKLCAPFNGSSTHTYPSIRSSTALLDTNLLSQRPRLLEMIRSH